MTVIFPLATMTCTAADATAINGLATDCGWGIFENGTGLFALGASIQSNAIRKSSTTTFQTLHRFNTTALNDGVDFSGVIKRAPDTGAAAIQGFACRGNGDQYTGAAAGWIVFYAERVSSSLVDLKYAVKSAGSVVQSGTLVSNFSWAASASFRLGVRLDAAVMQLWTADATLGIVEAIAAKTSRGSPVTLTPATLIANSYYAGGFAQGAVIDGEWDSMYLTVNVDPTEQITLSQSGSTVTIAWQDKTAAGTVTYDIHYTEDNGRTWTAITTDDAGTPYAWDVSAITAGIYRVRVRMGNTCQDSPSRVSAPFAVNMTAVAL
jgi:hypothetical protein